MKTARPLGALLLLSTSLFTLHCAGLDTSPDATSDVTRNGEHAVVGTAAQAATVIPISDHGGPIMRAPVNVYYIWYGNWTGNTAPTILDNFAQHIGDSPYFAINTTYADGAGAVNGGVTLKATTTDSYSQGSALTQDGAIESVVALALSQGKLPSDPNGVYFVLTSPDVTLSTGFCTSYCGWHANVSIGGVDIKYAFVGDPATQCPGTCEFAQTAPNGNAGADGMASIIAHELEESVTDPDGSAFQDSVGHENADKCAWTYTNIYTTSNGSLANMKVGTMDYFVQQNWVNENGGYCNQLYGLPFSGRDFRATTSTGDWHPGSYKAECGLDQAVTGLSMFEGSHAPHAALCGDDASGWRYPHATCRMLDFSSGDNRGNTSIGDWDQGYYKGECGTDEYVAGVSKNESGQINSLLCCVGAVSHTACSPRVYVGGDNRGNTATGDWDYGYYKGECAPGQYAAGASRASTGGSHAILCCSP